MVSIADFIRAAAQIYRAEGVTAGAAALDEASAFCPEPAKAQAVPGQPWLEQAATAPGSHPVAAMARDVGLQVDWRPAIRLDGIDFRGDYAYCVLAGPAAPCPSSEAGFGLFLQYPDTDYPSHCHEAVEDYFVLSGTAAWNKGNDPYVSVPPGRRIRHESGEWHATETFGDPLLAMWLWTGNLDPGTYRMKRRVD